MKNDKWDVIWKSVKESAVELVTTYDLARLIFFAGLLFCSGFVLDYLDIPSELIQKVPPIIAIVVLSVLLVVFIALLIGFHVLDLFRIASVNAIDALSFTALLSALTYTLIRVMVLGRGVYTCITALVSIISFLALLIRFVFRCVKLYRANSKRSNLIDLKDLMENRFARMDGKPILLLDKDVDYDLLDRDGITNQLYRSIIYCQPYQSYVISLEGDWGIGKTTIINNTKRLLRENQTTAKEYIYIDDFDPWLYGSDEALLLAMLETLIRHSGMRYSPSRISGIIQALRETTSDSHPVGSFLYKLLFTPSPNGNNIAKLKQRISRYLRTTNKTIVFFIDNFDRANEKNVMFLFKLIGIVFDLPGIIYVLSFEKDRINAILENSHHFDPRFTEKIIQQEIKVPAISEELAKNLYAVCITNLLEAYGIPLAEIQEYVPVAQYIVEKTRNIRSFKRMVNSVFPIVFCDDILLKKIDLLAIEAIHFYDPELFYTIYKNPKFFISHEKNPADVMRLGLNRKAFNDEGADFFKKLLEKHEDARKLLSVIFPYVKRYENGTLLEPDNLFSDPESAQVSKQSRICSGKYFDLYFSYSTNNYIAIRKNIESMIADVNKLKTDCVDMDLEETSKIIQRHLFSLKEEDHKEWIERLQNHITDISDEHILSVAASLYALIYYLSDDNSIFSLSARTRAEYIISILLEKCSERDFEEFLSLTREDYRQLRVIYSIHHWMASEKMEHNDVCKTRSEILLAHYTDMCNQIVKENICLFSEAYYYPHNVWGLYYYYKQADSVSTFTSYVTKNLSDETIYRVLWDITTISISDHYTYSIPEDNFIMFITNPERVDRLIEQRPPKSKDEEFVLRIYEAFRSGEPDEWGHKGITTYMAKGLNFKL